jgi:hypothetical protein
MGLQMNRLLDGLLMESQQQPLMTGWAIGLSKKRRAALTTPAVTAKIAVPTSISFGKSEGAHEN